MLVHKLHYHLVKSNYPNDLKNKLVNGFTSGFYLGHSGVVTNLKVPSSNFTHEEEIILQSKIDTEVSLGRVVGPFKHPPFHNFKISPISLREKSNPGNFRLIHNLSHPHDGSSINENIEEACKTVKYSGINDAINALLRLRPGAYLAKSDISDAFRLIPINISDHHKLGMYINGQYYYDTTLPMGASCSCALFESFSTALHHIFQFYAKGVTVIHYLDDFLIMADTKLKCQTYLELFLSLCKDMGVPISIKKTTVPSQTIVFLGVQLDSVNRLSRLPKDKLIQYSNDLDSVVNKRTITRRDLQSVIGKLSWAAAVVPARAFLRRLIDLLSTVHKQHHYITLTGSARRDLQIWNNFLYNYNGITFFRSIHYNNLDTINMCSDASLQGFGATFMRSWIQERYPPSWSRHHITILELYPVYVMLALFGRQITNSNVCFSSDNEAVVHMLNGQTSKHPFAMTIIRSLVLILVKYNIYLRAKHLPGIDNKLCDAISRFQTTPVMMESFNMEPIPTDLPDNLRPENFRDTSE